MTARAKAISAAILLAAIGQWAILRWEISFVEFLHGWPIRFADRPMTHGWVVVAAAVLAVGLVVLVHRAQTPSWRHIALTMVLGYALHLSYVLIQGRGLDPIRECVAQAGHSEFVRVAVARCDVLRTVTQYERLVADGQLGVYPNTKPPGHLLFYMLMQKCSNLWKPIASAEGRRDRLETAIVVFWPLLTFCCLPPLYLLSRALTDAKQAAVPCILYACMPNVAPGHLDQVLYPLLFVFSLYLVIESYRRDDLWLSLLAGMAVYGSVFVSFSLLALLPMAGMLLISQHVLHPRPRPRLGVLAKASMGVAAGLAGADVVCRLFLNYDVLHRFTNAIAYHQAFKCWRPGLGHLIYCASLNYIEFGLLTGLPLVALCFVGLARAARNAMAGRPHSFDGLTVALFALVVLLGCLGRTMGETSRLWLFLVPLLCVVAGREIAMLWRDERQWGVTFLVLIQMVTALLIARHWGPY